VLQVANARSAENLWPSVLRDGIEEKAQAAHMVRLRQLADTSQHWHLAVEMHRFVASNVLDRQDMATAGCMQLPEVHQAIAMVERHEQELRDRGGRARFARAAPHLA
jgi:hypothetical protein